MWVIALIKKKNLQLECNFIQRKYLQRMKHLKYNFGIRLVKRDFIQLINSIIEEYTEQ